MNYIIELSEPMHHARFYLGHCRDGRIQQRLKEHRLGRGSKMLAAAAGQGILFRVIATSDNGTRGQERALKRQKNTPRIVKQIKSGKRPEWRMWQRWHEKEQ